jgi:hypothetical protein
MLLNARLKGLLVLMLASSGLACVEVVGPEDVPIEVSFSVVAELLASADDATLEVTDSAVVRLLDTSGGVSLWEVRTPVDLAQSQWTFEASVTASATRTFQSVVEVELFEASSAGAIVHFSGLSDPFTLDMSESGRDRYVEIWRGPLANLNITSLAFVTAGPLSILEGASRQLEVSAVGANSQTRIFFEPADPSVVSVTPDGRLLGMSQGATQVFVRAGRLQDQIEVSVDEVVLPSLEELEQSVSPTADYVTDDSFISSLQDPIAGALLQQAVRGMVAAMLDNDAFGAVGLFEDAAALWTDYGAGSDLRRQDGPLLGVISLTLIHAADALGIDFLR